MKLSLVRVLSVVAAAVALSTSIGCSGERGEGDDETPVTQDELRRQSEDLFKPKTAAIQTVTSTLPGIDHWDLHVGETGTTIIGWSKTKKRKAIFVQLFDKGRAVEQAIALRGTGYLTSTDFRLDRNDNKNELRLLADAIKKDFTPAVDAVPAVATPAEVPSDDAPVTADDPSTSTSTSTPTPTSTSPSPSTTPPKPCVKSTLKLVLFGLEMVRDVADVITNVIYCQDDKSSCGAAVASFSHGVYLSSTYKDLTCKR